MKEFADIYYYDNFYTKYLVNGWIKSNNSI